MNSALRSDELFDDKDVPAIIVCGRVQGGKAHASWFAEADRARAIEAAALMGIHALPVSNDALRALANKLPLGRVFSSGRAFVPFVKSSLFDELARHLPKSAQPSLKLITGAKASKPVGGQTASADGDDADAADQVTPIEHDAEADLPTDWSKLKAGHVVLAEESRDDGWWEAVVVAAKDNDVFELRWRHFPAHPNFVRHRTRLALMHPRLTPAKS